MLALEEASPHAHGAEDCVAIVVAARVGAVEAGGDVGIRDGGEIAVGVRNADELVPGAGPDLLLFVENAAVDRRQMRVASCRSVQGAEQRVNSSVHRSTVSDRTRSL